MTIYEWLFIGVLCVTVLLWMLFHLCSRGLHKLHKHRMAIQVGLDICISHDNYFNRQFVLLKWTLRPWKMDVVSRKETIVPMWMYTLEPPTAKDKPAE